jgi:hypothetical protein
MTDQQHPITPPLALINQWWDEAHQNAKYNEPIGPLVATQAARWGADQELEACEKWLSARTGFMDAHDLHSARRPKPPSLKEQALAALATADGADHPVVCTVITADQHAIIRQALEALDD